jgi:hypothetical protein
MKSVCRAGKNHTSNNMRSHIEASYMDSPKHSKI